MSPLIWIILLPLLTAVALVFVPRTYQVVIRTAALACTAVVALIALGMARDFDAAPVIEGGYRFVQRIPWVPSLGISLSVGVDGINLGLLVMGALVAFCATCVSSEIKERTKEFYVLLLVMTGGILGAFASLDIFFLYFFHELALVPTFIMIGVWGRGGRRGYAAFQITLYLTIGALVALVGLIALYLQSGARTFDLVELTRYLAANPMPAGRQVFIFPWLLFGLGILVSLWPFHTWAPLGYGSAPTATAMLHAGVLKKFGLFALLKVAIPLLPEGAKVWLPWAAWLCLGNILYCGWVAMRQKDLNLLIGNSSVAHVGFVFLGFASLTWVGVTGAVVVMVAHGFLAALSFALSGWLHGQSRSLDMTRMGGLLKQVPFVGTVMVMAMFAGCGLPGFGNFVGEMLVLFGGWQSDLVICGGWISLRWFVAAAAWGALVVAAVYMLRAVRAMWHGPRAEDWATAVDPAGLWRKLPYLVLVAGLLVIGMWPRILTDRIAPGARGIVEGVVRSTPPPSLAAQVVR
ncbi:MAG: NADH-quinone oxidoreductase subunit M [Verrucomicrobiales bacterium]|nr:NADH-quinone oxidoreductase subunit M [Verrucomicrobiales bacterium]